jgi:hypothetical protein
VAQQWSRALWRCGSPLCRRLITGADWRLPTLQERYCGHFSPFINRRLGVCPLEFEIWASICLLTYDDLVDGAVDDGEVLVVSLEKLLLMKALAMHKEKYLTDTQLIVRRIVRSQNEQYPAVRARNEALLAGIDGVAFLERAGA